MPHAYVFTPGKHISGDVQSMKLMMTSTASRWNRSSDYYMTRSNHVGNVLYKMVEKLFKGSGRVSTRRIIF